MGACFFVFTQFIQTDKSILKSFTCAISLKRVQKQSRMRRVDSAVFLSCPKHFVCINQNLPYFQARWIRYDNINHTKGPVSTITMYIFPLLMFPSVFNRLYFFVIQKTAPYDAFLNFFDVLYTISRKSIVLFVKVFNVL